jgi:hypothetical protein
VSRTGALEQSRVAFPVWFYPAALALVALQITVLHHFGQPFLSRSGRILLWVNDVWSSETSQQFADWYSFSHIIHGFIFYGILHLVAPRLPVAARLLIAMGVEVVWEITENSPATIQHYRQQAIAAGYLGDSILNSVMDTLTMCTGFLIAWRAPAKYIAIAALCLELFTLAMVRDNLTLNVIGLVLPSDWAPIRAIHTWQAASKPPPVHPATPGTIHD